MKEMKRVITLATDFALCNILRVEVGTTGHCGGDTGHGGRTYFSLADKSSTDMRLRFTKDGLKSDWIDMMGGKIEIAFGGDNELDTFIDALEFAVEQLKANRDKEIYIGGVDLD